MIMLGLLGLDLFGLVVGVVTHLPSVKVESLEPSFDDPVTNVTAIAGDTVTLPCSVKNLKDYKVMWLDHRTKTLTLEARRIIADERITIERPDIGDWNLYIHGVELSDAGKYMCQVNTVPVKIKYVILTVHEPPEIIPELSSKEEVFVRESDTVQLVCNVTGVPTPTVRWYKKSPNRRHYSYNDKEMIGHDGMVLRIRNISRYCDDVYQCVADNGVKLPVSRDIKVTVQFPPEIHLPTKKLSQAVGKETILNCEVTSNPSMYSAWTRDGITIQNSDKFKIDIYEDYKNTMTLSMKISDIQKPDFGVYRCEAQNEFGRDFKDFFLYELVTTTPSPSTPSAVTTTTPVHVYVFTWTPSVRTYTPRREYHSKDRPPLATKKKPKGSNGQPRFLPNNTFYLIGLLTTLSVIIK